jgi:hypothetical protein
LRGLEPWEGYGIFVTSKVFEEFPETSIEKAKDIFMHIG